MKRFLCLLLTLALLGCGLSGCASDTATAPETTPQTDATEPTVPEETPATALDIDTTGGAVLVGHIGYDDTGWFFSPEQPLNITFRFFHDEPSVYAEQTVIRMADPKDDGIEKALYIGDTVTIAGRLSFLRDDFETLYFLPYTITKGKTVASGYGDPTLTYPEEPEDLFDPTIPLPAAMTPTVRDGHYTYNPYRLSEETLSFLGNEFADVYVGFVDAFLNHESTFPCPQPHYAEMLSTVLFYEFPLYHACAEPFDASAHYDADAGTATIVYKTDADEHRRLVEQLTTAADAMLADASPDNTDEENAKHLYHALASRMTYDDSAMADIEKKESCYAYLNHSGVCVTFANVYNQLLTQVGIRTGVASCSTGGSEGHAWSIVTLDGKDYFCDPTYELSYDDGNGYRFFGLTYAERTADGLGVSGIYRGRYHMTAMSPDEIADTPLTR